MAFETGYAANEFELQQKLNAFIMSIDGWTKVSQISPCDAVYFSSGTDGFKDIYIRAVAGQTEDPIPFGGSQKDFGDGYVGYLNFFAYQYFPEDGDAYDGYGQAGQLGPLLYWFCGDDEYDVYHNRIATDGNYATWKWINYAGRKYPPGEDTDWWYYYAGALAHCNATFDGRRYWYYWAIGGGGGSAFFRFDLTREATDILINMVEGNKYFCGLAYWVDPDTRQEYIWYYKNDQTGAYNLDDGSADPVNTAAQLMRWDISAGVGQYGFSGPVWPDTGDRHADYGDLIWDGHNHLYVFRGTNKPHWAKYHIPSDTWTNLIDLPVNSYNKDSMCWLDKKISGFDYHRIYWPSYNNNRIYYINIDENNGMPVGGWSYINPPTTYVYQNSKLFHNRRNRFFFYPGYDATHGRELWYGDITAGTPSWVLNKSSSTYMPTDGTFSNSTFAYVDGYMSRVRTSLYDRTQYWFMGNKDRILVLTKADGIYSYCYMGTFSPYASTVPHALTTTDIYAGNNVEVSVNVLKGEFEVGQRMFIADVTDRGGGEYTGQLENITRLFKPMEMFEIAAVDPGVSITISSLKNNYPAGSRIAFDPQPVGISLEGLDRIQLLNHINTHSPIGSIDMGENIAKLQTVKDAIVNASGGDERRGTYALWPVNIINGGTDAASSGTEARGGLIGVFAVSSTGDLSSEDIITVGTNQYMVFEVASAATFLYAFGPINE